MKNLYALLLTCFMGSSALAQPAHTFPLAHRCRNSRPSRRNVISPAVRLAVMLSNLIVIRETQVTAVLRHSSVCNPVRHSVNNLSPE